MVWYCCFSKKSQLSKTKDPYKKEEIFNKMMVNNRSSLYTIRSYYSFETDRVENVIEHKPMNQDLQTHTSHQDQK